MRRLAAALALAAWLAAPAGAQTPTAAAAPEDKSARLLDEIKPFAYVEASYVVNLTGAGRDAVNELRLYDLDEGFTFNVAELVVRKEPSEAYPWGFGLALTAGLDAQKNHSLGLFREARDSAPFRNTRWVDVQEAWIGVRIPLGEGLTVKAGKMPSPAGYEVSESPLNLNTSRGYLFNYAGPLTQTGVVLSYAFAEWVTVQLGMINGWDSTSDNNGARSWTGQAAVGPLAGLSTTFSWIAGPEQDHDNRSMRYLLDLVVVYTGVKGLTLAGEVAYGHDDHEEALAALETRRAADSSWWGWALYAAYDWTDRLRTALRQEYFKDADGARTGFGAKLSLWSTTATVQYKLWRGLVGRLEYRHDQATEKVFKIRTPGVVPTSRSLDTIAVSVYYQFF